MNSNDPVTLIRPANEGDEWQVICPKCRFEYVHHDNGPVEVWQRSEDSGESGYAVLSGEQGVRAIAPAENPSLRRSGIRLHFWCEGCGEKFALTFAQHKGETFVRQIKFFTTRVSDFLYGFCRGDAQALPLGSGLSCCTIALQPLDLRSTAGLLPYRIHERTVHLDALVSQ